MEKPYVVGQIVLAPGEKFIGPKMDFPPWLPVDAAKIKREAFAAGVAAMRELAALGCEAAGYAHTAATIRALPDPEP